MLLAQPEASADCVGYASENDRISAASNAPLIAIATVRAIEYVDRPPAGGQPIDVYTFKVDTLYRGDLSADTVRVAAPQDSSISRSFGDGQRYFLAPRDATIRSSQWSPTDVARFAPFVDDTCSPTTALNETSTEFAKMIASAFPAQPPTTTELLAPGESNSYNYTIASIVVIAAIVVAAIALPILFIRRRHRYSNR